MTPRSDKVAALLAKAGRLPAQIIAEAHKPVEPLTLAQQRANVVEWAMRDPANIAMLVDAIGSDRIANAMKEKRCDLGLPMPRLEEVTAAQCSLFDNWPMFSVTGKKPNKNHKGNSKGANKPHHQCEFELFTVPEGVEIVNDVNSAFQGVAPLLTHPELVARIKSLRELGGRPWRPKRPDDQQGADLEAFGNRLLAMASANPAKLYGPVFLSRGGTKYFLGHYASADAAAIGTPALEVELRHEGLTPVVFRRFASTYSNNAKLKGNVVGHSRVSRRADHTSWRTANF